jgi:penicillin amidase
VEIIRDRHGIPHIYAKNDNDAWYGLGFAHAQDRLWQMEMNRRIGAGRLSEILGEKTIATDKFLRTLSVYHFAERTVANLDPGAKAALDAYAAGVNAYIAGHDGPLPPEFIILGVEPAPWKPADSLVWAKMMAWDLGANWRKEIMRYQMVQAGLNARQLTELFPPYPGDAPITLPDLAKIYDGVDIDAHQFAAIPPAVVPDQANGSNNWAVGPDRSASGKPLLANDPHLGLSVPSVWYFAHVEAPGLKVMGATLPGIPGIVLGRNDRIAWGFTNTGPDVQDMYIERLLPGDPSRYVTPTGSAKFEVRREVIKVKGADDVVIEVRSTRHGPVISDASGSSAKVAGKGHVVAFAWTALRDDSGTVRATLDLNKAGNWSEFVDALRYFDVPQQNVVYADVEGNIGFYAPGRVPVRKPGNTVLGFMPVPGWDATYDWDGYIPFDELPHAYNPARGYVATANHKVVSDAYPHFITLEWAAPYRARRIEELLASRKIHTIDSFRTIQSDVKSLIATDLLPRLIKAEPNSQAARDVRDLMAEWDARMDRNRPEPLIFMAWMRNLTKRVYRDELGSMFKAYWEYRPVFMTNVLIGGQSHWCDDIKTPQVENCDSQITAALDDALAELETLTGGADYAAWRWGDYHYAHSDHNPFTHVSPLDKLFDIRISNGGGAHTINVGRHKFANRDFPYRQYHGPSLRAIYDLGDLDRSRWIHSAGQSGNPLSDLFSNFTERWRDVEDLPMTMKRSEIEAGALGALRLTPAGN